MDATAITEMQGGRYVTGYTDCDEKKKRWCGKNGKWGRVWEEHVHWFIKHNPRRRERKKLV
jgi:hypothetical protein